MYSPKRRLRLFRDPAWAGAPPDPPVGSATDILSFARTLATTYEGYDAEPTDGGALTINSQAVGNYELTARKANTTISSFTAADWFTNTKDTTSSWIIVNGDLTIDAGQTLIPPVRKLFTVVYVTGNLVWNGVISMTARGANHSGTGDSGGATTAVAIRIGTGTFSAVVNPQIPAAGGAGGAGRTTFGQNPGTSGTNGGTGGGAGGQWAGGSAIASGAGSAGTCFSGGAGGGGRAGVALGAGGSGGANGGAGGNAGPAGAGGAGNPGGKDGGGGGNGTGGTLIVICEGELSGTGSGLAQGLAGGSFAALGGGSGGGSITVLFGTNLSGPSVLTASGGSGGPGGNGTARKLAIGAN